jgi:hypothetical protein
MTGDDVRCEATTCSIEKSRRVELTAALASSFNEAARKGGDITGRFENVRRRCINRSRLFSKQWQAALHLKMTYLPRERLFQLIFPANPGFECVGYRN